MGGRKGRGGRRPSQPYSTVIAGKATNSSQKAPIPHHKAIGDVWLAVRAVPCPTHPIGTFHWHHYHIQYFTGLAKYPPEKQTSSHWPMETLCMDSP